VGKWMPPYGPIEKGYRATDRRSPREVVRFGNRGELHIGRQ